LIHFYKRIKRINIFRVVKTPTYIKSGPH